MLKLLIGNNFERWISKNHLIMMEMSVISQNRRLPPPPSGIFGLLLKVVKNVHFCIFQIFVFFIRIHLLTSCYLKLVKWVRNTRTYEPECHSHGGSSLYPNIYREAYCNRNPFPSKPHTIAAKLPELNIVEMWSMKYYLVR